VGSEHGGDDSHQGVVRRRAVMASSWVLDPLIARSSIILREQAAQRRLYPRKSGHSESGLTRQEVTDLPVSSSGTGKPLNQELTKTRGLNGVLVKARRA
jgi:hypothetical protein